MKVIRKTTIWLSLAAVVVFLLADALIAPPAGHDVHTPGGIALKVQIAVDSPSPFVSIRPSQSLADMRCQRWQKLNAGPCPDDPTLTQTYWPQLTQSTDTLYVGWLPCAGIEDGVHTVYVYYQFNIEYLADTRALIIHCYSASAFLVRPCCPGVGFTGYLALLVVPTNGIRHGAISIVQDDRREHLVGDQSDESLIATATIG